MTAFVEHHQILWESVFAVLTGIYVILSFFEDASVFALNPYTATLFGLSAIFVAEFAIRCWDAPSRHAYLREHWLDLATSFPLVGPLRALRLLRLLRFVRLGLSIRKLVLGGTGSASWLIWPFVLLFWCASAYALWLSEHAVNPSIATFNGALLYAFLTACTVGYGSFTPVTIEGKIISGAIVFVAIGLVGFTSARLTAMYLGQHESDLPDQLRVIEANIAEVKALLERSVSGAAADVDAGVVKRIDEGPSWRS